MMKHLRHILFWACTTICCTVFAGIGQDSATICQGDSMVMYGMVLKTKGSYNIAVTADSSVLFKLNIAPTYNKTRYIMPTQGDTLISRGEITVFEPGKRYTFHDTLESAFGCDSIVHTYVNAVQPRTYRITDDITVCQNDILVWEGDTIDTKELGERQIEKKLYSMYGADSVRVLALSVVFCSKSYAWYNIHLCQGDSAQYLGKWYKQAAEDTVVLHGQDQYGGDSIIYISVSQHDSVVVEFDCIWREGHKKTWYTHHLSNKKPGTYTLTSGIFLKTQYGCDSLEIMHLTVLPRTYGTLDTAVCAGEALEFAGKRYTQSGTYEGCIDNHFGGDSIVTINLIIGKKYDRKWSETITYEDTRVWGGMTYKNIPPGKYVFTDSTVSQYGCDSISMLTLTVIKAPQKIIWEQKLDTLAIGQSIAINAYSTSGLPLQYALTKGWLVDLAGNIMTVNAVGIITLTLSQPGDSNYNAAEPVTRKIVLTRGTDIEETTAGTTGTDKTYKVTDGNHIYILRNGATYSIDGLRIH